MNILLITHLYKIKIWHVTSKLEIATISSEVSAEENCRDETSISHIFYFQKIRNNKTMEKC